MKCPFCGAEMETLLVDGHSDLIPALSFANKDNPKQIYQQHLKELKCCKTCGFVAPFIDIETITQE